MTYRRKNKAELSPEEKLKAVYLHELRGFDQDILADIFGVNAGRIADAVKSVRKAIGMENGDDLVTE